jgi:type I restriction enzyme S subunit
MNKEMVPIKLEGLIDFKNGKIASKKLGTIPIYGGNGILGYTDESNYENVLIIGRVGAYCGSVHIEKGKCWVSDNAIAGVHKQIESNEYNYYLLKCISLNKKQIGSSQPLLTQGILNRIDVNIYSDVSTRAKIASVLSTIDSKIELNNRINAELEAMTKTLYDFWFVQFDFPDENGKPYKNSGGKMVWNEELKREIPEGWEVNILDSILSELTKGFTTEYVEKSNLINLNQKVNKGFSLDRQYFKYLDESIEIPKQKYAREKDILINSLGQGTLGRVHFFCEKANNIVVDQHLFILRVNENKVTATYMYLLLTSKAYQIQIDRQITGSTGMQMLNASSLKDIDIIIPNLEVMNLFEKNVYPFFEMVVINEIENQKLSELRDWLLPMLMNGQVKVS